MKQFNKLLEVLGGLSSCKPSSYQCDRSLMHNKHSSASILTLNQNGIALPLIQHATQAPVFANSQKVLGLGVHLLTIKSYQNGVSNVLLRSSKSFPLPYSLLATLLVDSFLLYLVTYVLVGRTCFTFWWCQKLSVRYTVLTCFRQHVHNTKQEDLRRVPVWYQPKTLRRLS